ALGAGELGADGVEGYEAPVGLVEDGLDEVADGDDADHAGDDGFEGPEAAALEAEDDERCDAGDDGGGEEVHAEQEVEAEGGAHERGEVGGHGDDLGYDPHADDDGPGELLAAGLGQAEAGGEAERRGQGP